jgi:hypothetical protein
MKKRDQIAYKIIEARAGAEIFRVAEEKIKYLNLRK